MHFCKRRSVFKALVAKNCTFFAAAGCWGPGDKEWKAQRKEFKANRKEMKPRHKEMKVRRKEMKIESSCDFNGLRQILIFGAPSTLTFCEL